MKTILLIDDEKQPTEFLSKFIERKGFKVICAYTGEDGIELYKANSPDCVFLDLHLPRMDGLTVLKKLKEINSNACVYLSTGDENAALRQQGEASGAKGYLLKPINVKEVTEILAELHKTSIA